jgi:hypothetical protein
VPLNATAQLLHLLQVLKNQHVTDVNLKSLRAEVSILSGMCEMAAAAVVFGVWCLCAVGV